MGKCNLPILEKQEEPLFKHVSGDRQQVIKQRHSAVKKIPFNSFIVEPLSPSERAFLSVQAYNKACYEEKSRARRADREREARTGLSNNKQVRQNPKNPCKYWMRDRFTNKLFQVDSSEMRLRQLQKRVFQCMDTLDILDYSNNPDRIDGVGAYSHQLITLTYDPKKGDWVEGDISKFMDRFRRYIERKVSTPVKDPWLYLGLIWVAEYMKNGMVHYHIVISSPKEWGFLDMPKRVWKMDEGTKRSKGQGLWLHGSSTYGLRDGSVTVRSPYYLAKYVSKERTKENADRYRNQRSFGCSMPKKTSQSLIEFPQAVYQYQKLPKWLKIKYSHYMRSIEYPCFLSGREDMSQVFKNPLQVIKVSGGYVVNNVYFESPFSFYDMQGGGGSTPPPPFPLMGVAGGGGVDPLEPLMSEWKKQSLEITLNSL